MFITHRRFPFIVSSLWTFPSFKYFVCQVVFFSSEVDKQLQYLLFFSGKRYFTVFSTLMSLRFY